MISVVIPSYNSEATITACLRSIFSQDIEEEFEVIVVDSSTDKTPGLICDNFPSAQLTHLDHRVDAGTARQIGLKQAGGRLISFIDSDCIIRPDYLRRMSENHSSGNYPACGGPVINGNPDSSVSWAGYIIEFNEFFPDGTEHKTVGHVPTCNICYKREVFDLHGGFPANEVLMHEDLLFNWRVCGHENKILFDPFIPVAHHHRTTLRSYLRHQYKIGIGTVQVLRKTDLRGSSLVKHPLLATFLLPALPLIKFSRTTARVLGWDCTILLKRPLIIPLLLTGLLWWLTGFATELYNREAIDAMNTEKIRT
jgi:glycosyltransferase involved in cell wall biosynthesis